MRDDDGSDAGTDLETSGSATDSRHDAVREETDTESAAEGFNSRRLILSTVGGLVGLMLLVAAIGYWFRAPLMLISRAFVDVLGGPGIAVGFYIPDAFTVPVPNDAFSTFGIAGGMGFWEVVAWGTLGSIAGGLTGWLIGGRLRRTPWLSRFLKGKGSSLSRAIRRNGVLVVAVAALTPLPYSISAWAAGAVQLPLGPFLAASMLRVIRVAGTLYLIQIGLMSTG